MILLYSYMFLNFVLFLWRFSALSLTISFFAGDYFEDLYGIVILSSYIVIRLLKFTTKIFIWKRYEHLNTKKNFYFDKRILIDFKFLDDIEYFIYNDCSIVELVSVKTLRILFYILKFINDALKFYDYIIIIFIGYVLLKNNW